MATKPKQRFHLDRRADHIADAGKGPPDQELTAKEIADWLGVTEAWVLTAKRENCGPPFIQPYPEVTRYRRGDVIKWLRGRARMVANEYA